MITADMQTAAITIAPPDNDENRVEDSVTLTAHSGSAGNSMEPGLGHDQGGGHPRAACGRDDGARRGRDKPLDPQPTSVPEGESVMVAVMPVDKDGDV